MPALAEVNLYRLAPWSGEIIDPIKDVENSILGAFTWRHRDDDVPNALQLITTSVTVDDLYANKRSVFDDMATAIIRYFYQDNPPSELALQEAQRVAKDLAQRIRNASGDTWHYVHSFRHDETVKAMKQRDAARSESHEPLADWERELLEGSTLEQ